MGASHGRPAPPKDGPTGNIATRYAATAATAAAACYSPPPPPSSHGLRHTAMLTTDALHRHDHHDHRRHHDRRGLHLVP